MSQVPVPQETPLTRTQRWAQVFAVLVAVFGLAVGFMLKEQLIGSTVLHDDRTAGIRARYPSNWLLDTKGNYVFRVRDPSASGFLTTLQVAVVPIGDATARNVVDNLILERATTLTGYRVQAITEIILPDGEEGTQQGYFYVGVDPNPFLEGVPVVVRGLDVVVIKRGQAVIITFRADKERFDAELGRFEQFLATLEF